MLTLGLAAACVHRQPTLVMDREVYTAAVAVLFPNGPPSTYVIREQPMLIRRLTEVEAFGGVDSFGFEVQGASAWKDVPVALRRALTMPQPIETKPLPAAPRLASDGARARVPGALPQGPNYFAPPVDAINWIVFSRTLLAHDSRDAIIYYEKYCGSLCANGAYLWLHRASTSTVWNLRREIVVWMA